MAFRIDHQDPVVISRRLDDLQPQLGRIERDSVSYAAFEVGVTITTTNPYPTVAGSVFAVQISTVSANEVEGAAVTVSPQTGNIVFALNLGAAVPASGTKILITRKGGRWVFRYG